MTSNGALGTLEPVTNGAEESITAIMPYRVEMTLEGTSPLLFHAWNNESVAAKAKAAKGSASKKSDDVESYVYRTQSGEIALPGEYVRMALVNAARFRQDPRSPRKSAMDLFKAAVVSLTEYASLGKAEWDYLDQRRVQVQRNAVTRMRPAFFAGWRATLHFQVNLPEYVSQALLLDVTTQAGKVIGVGDFRPTYGRFAVVHFEMLED